MSMLRSISFLNLFLCRIKCLTGASVRLHAAFGEGLGPIQLGSLSCSGRETSLVNCTKGHIPASCTHADDAGVVCQGEGEEQWCKGVREGEASRGGASELERLLDHIG